MSRKTQTLPRAKPPRFAARHTRGIETRAAILEAAEGVFAEAGLGGARTDAIAARAGVNKALLYYYFKSKNALYYAILEEHLKEFRHRILEVLCDDDSPRAKVLGYVSVHFDFIASRPYYARLVQRLAMSGGKLVERLARECFAPVYRKLASVIEEGVRKGEFWELNSSHAALSLIALIVFYFSASPLLIALTHHDPYGKAQLAARKAEVLKFIRHAIFKDGREAAL